ncbi:hypothetical protein JXA80_12425 [bacterium]|nr:hypothetical protein [candidate division CSSED10-310 bacterium]
MRLIHTTGIIGMVMCLMVPSMVMADDSETVVKQGQPGMAAASEGAGAAVGPGTKSTEIVMMKTAEITVPELNQEMAEKIVFELKNFKGIESIKPDFEAGNILVTYDPTLDFKADPFEKILSLNEKAIIKGIVDTKVKKADKCSGCPQKDKCAGETHMTKGKTSETK